MSHIDFTTAIGPLLLAGFVVAVVLRGLWVRRTRARSTTADLAATWGKFVPRERDMSSIAALFRQRPITEEEGAYEVSDRAWRDLGMDDVFARIDRCASALGQQLLYRYLRAPRLTLRPLLDLDRRVSAFVRSPEVRTQSFDALRRLSGSGANSLVRIVHGPSARIPRGASLFPLATMATLFAAALSFVQPLAIIALLALVVANIMIRVSVFRDLSSHVEGLRQVARMIEVARELARIDDPALTTEIKALRSALGSLGSRRVTVAWLTLDRLRLDDASAMVVEYANVFLLLDVNAYVKELVFAREYRATLATLFEKIAELDVAMCIANYRTGEAYLARPELSDREDAFMALGVRHPLVADAVPNDATLAKSGYLVTGSNMAGKSTFLKAVALQAVLAQTIFATTSRRYKAPFLRVQTLVEIADDLLASRSHFRVEAEVARSMLDTSKSGKCLCVVDELFRGTNTADRVAAGAAFLRALHRSGAHVIAATHDRELLGLLRSDLEPHHFSEKVEEGELRFDYVLRKGAAAPRNALAVLRLVGFPDAVLEEADCLAQQIEGDTSRGAPRFPMRRVSPG